MRKFMLMLTFMIGCFISQPAQALGNVHFSELSVDIWPEYDQPAVLMIYRITLAPDTTLPASLTFHIPSKARINAVAENEPGKNLTYAPYDETIQGQWALLKITTNSSEVRLEYYLPLVKNGTARHLLFSWEGDYAVDALEANFLAPFGAQNVIISVAPTQTGQGQDGLTNYQVQTTKLASGKPFSFTIDYQRNTDDLSISSQPVQAVSTPGPDTPGRMVMTGAWVLAGIGVLLIVAGIVGFAAWQRGGQRVKKMAKPLPQREMSEDEFIYCHQCGKRAQPGDVFCRTCGTRLKRGQAD